MPDNLNLTIQKSVLHVILSKADTNQSVSRIAKTGLSLTIYDKPTAINTGGSSDESTFLPTPDRVDDANASYFYFGWDSVEGSWLVRRQLRSDASIVEASVVNNPTYITLTEAWSSKETLNFE